MAPLWCWLLLLSHGQRAVSQTKYPLSSVDISDACNCDEEVGEGWSTEYNACLVGEVTDCTECISSSRCAVVTVVVGNGVGGFVGECTSTDCLEGSDTSVSNPVALSLDQDGNLFIADHGNNRIRLYSTLNDTVITVAGSGRYGFSGDGEDCRNAKLRHPEGVAVWPLASSRRRVLLRQVYFSDSLNQRVRKCTEQEDGSWLMSTVVGSGEFGTACSGCDAVTSPLRYPKDVVFDSAGVLYIADRGSSSILKLSTDGILTKLLGGAKDYDMRTEQGFLLAGSWKEANGDVTIHQLTKLSVNHRDNLMWVDSGLGIIYQTPLYEHAEDLLQIDGHVGRIIEFWLSMFSENSAVDQIGLYNNLLKWLPHDDMLDYTPRDTKYNRFEYGYTYWRYGMPSINPSPLVYPWCSNPESTWSLCEDASAQNSEFSDLQGLCWDGETLYVTDTGRSEVLSFEVGSNAEVSLGTDVRYTAEGCVCLQYWSSDESLPDKSQCAQNPSATSSSVDCDVTSYCGTPDNGSVDWCYIDTSEAGQTERCTNAAGLYLSWGWCQAGSDNWLTRVQQSRSVLGHELRMNKAYDMTASQLSDLSPYIGWDLAVSVAGSTVVYIPMWSVLLSFEVPSSNWSTYDGCVDDCCGLPANGSTCSISDVSDVDVISNALAASNVASLSFTWDVVDTMAIDTLSKADETTCNAKCILNEDCAAVSLACSGVCDMPCVLFQDTWPNEVYTAYGDVLDRTSTSGQERGKFSGPLNIMTRFHGADYSNFYIDTSGRGGTFGYVGGPLTAYAMSATSCLNQCIATENCQTIALPGCWLLNWTSVVELTTDDPHINVMQKKEVVSGVIGLPDVFTYGNIFIARESYTNGPTSCTVNTNSEVFFTDGRNERIRKVSVVHALCAAVQRDFITDADKTAWQAHTTNIATVCAAVSNLAEIQRALIESDDLDLLRSGFCDLQSPCLPTANVIVLCSVCTSMVASGTVSSWPSACPAQDLCTCRNAIVAAMTSVVYLNCPNSEAQHDSWHKWITAYTTCWEVALDSDELYLSDENKTAELETAVQSCST